MEGLVQRNLGDFFSHILDNLNVTTIDNLSFFSKIEPFFLELSPTGLPSDPDYSIFVEALDSIKQLLTELVIEDDFLPFILNRYLRYKNWQFRVY